MAAGSLFGCYEGQANGVDNVQSTPERRPCETRYSPPSPSWKIRHKYGGGLPHFVVFGGGLVTAYFFYHSFFLFGGTASWQHGNDLVMGPGCGPRFLFHHTGIGRGWTRIGVGFQLIYRGLLELSDTKL